MHSVRLAVSMKSTVFWHQTIFSLLDSYKRTFMSVVFKMSIFFFILSRARLSPLGTAANIGLLYKPQLIDDGDCGAIGGMKIDRETEVLGENLPQHHIAHHKFHMKRPGFELGVPWWKTSD
jgi:hypothetical protein